MLVEVIAVRARAAVLPEDLRMPPCQHLREEALIRLLAYLDVVRAGRPGLPEATENVTRLCSMSAK